MAIDETYGLSFGDSGGPLLKVFNEELFTYGVLSSGYEDEENIHHAFYSAPYFFINWINNVLPSEMRIQTGFPLLNQFHFNNQDHKLKRISDLLDFNNSYCTQFAEGWRITEKYGCFPSTRESCIKHSIDFPSGYILWNEDKNECEINLDYLILKH